MTSMPEGISQEFMNVDAQLKACEERVGRLIREGKETEVTKISDWGEDTRAAINMNVQEIANFAKQLRSIAHSNQELQLLDKHITKLGELDGQIVGVNKILVQFHKDHRKEKITYLTKTINAANELRNMLLIIRALGKLGIQRGGGAQGEVLFQGEDADGNQKVLFQYEDAAKKKHTTSITLTPPDAYKIGNQIFMSHLVALEQLRLMTASTQATKTEETSAVEKKEPPKEPVRPFDFDKFKEICLQSADKVDEKELAKHFPSPDMVNATNKRGWTPLHMACETGNLKIVEWLLKNGANLETTDKDGRTALHVIHYDSVSEELVKLILQNAREKDFVNIQSKKGWSALHEAILYKRPVIAKLLIESNADIYAKTNNDASTLHIACRSGSKELVELVLRTAYKREKASISDFINAKDSDGKSASDFATGTNRSEIVELLEYVAQGKIGWT